MQQVEKLAGETNRDFAKRIITDKLVSLELKPGQMVSENELAAELSISRTPVREALIELSKVKIVEVIPQKGIRVSLIDDEKIEEFRFMRFALETAIMDIICKITDPHEFDALIENVKLQKFYLENDRTDTLWELDNSFHKELFRISKMSSLYDLVREMSICFDRVRNMNMVSGTSTNIQIVDEHSQILEAILQGDAARAKEYTITHLSHYQIDKASIQKNYPASYFQNSEFG